MELQISDCFAIPKDAQEIADQHMRLKELQKPFLRPSDAAVDNRDARGASLIRNGQKSSIRPTDEEIPALKGSLSI
jgi:hypothetical protein